MFSTFLMKLLFGSENIFVIPHTCFKAIPTTQYFLTEVTCVFLSRSEGAGVCWVREGSWRIDWEILPQSYEPPQAADHPQRPRWHHHSSVNALSSFNSLQRDKIGSWKSFHWRHSFSNLDISTCTVAPSSLFVEKNTQNLWLRPGLLKRKWRFRI